MDEQEYEQVFPVFVKLTLLDNGHEDEDGQFRLAIATEYTYGLPVEFVARLLYAAALELAPGLAEVAS